MIKPKSQDTLCCEIVTVTPELAALFRRDCLFPRQRNLRSENVGRLAREMGKGNFLAGTQIFMCVFPDGSMMMTNGNHTCEAIMRSGVPQNLTITFLRVKSLDEAGMTYAVQDNQKVRSLGDVLKSLGGENTVFSRACAMAVALIDDDFKTTHTVRDKVEKALNIDKYERGIALFEQCIKGAKTPHKRLMHAVPYAAVAIYTLEHQPTAAHEFWTEVALESGPYKAPSRILADAIERDELAGADRRWKAIQKSARAWNVFYNGGEARTLLREFKDGSLYILGTPWHDGKPFPIAEPEPKPAEKPITHHTHSKFLETDSVPTPKGMVGLTARFVG